MVDKNISDNTLAIQLQFGDLTALTTLINRYEKPLLRYATHLGCSEPEDSVQETFIKMYQNINNYDPNRKFSSWLYRLAHNTTVSRLRARRFTLPFADYLDSWLGSTDTDPLDNLATTSELERCLPKLAPHYLAPLTLYYFEDKSYQEISDILRLPIGTVSARINRAKKILRSICKKNH
ncbi:MAG: RNA polymerase sigma factor [Candidatus Microgenomates bacterium]